MAILQLKKDDREFKVENETPLVEILRDEMVSIEFSCEDGICGTCECIVLEGAENLSDPTDREKNMLYLDGEHKNHRLSCQSKIMQGKVVVNSSY